MNLPKKEKSLIPNLQGLILLNRKELKSLAA